MTNIIALLISALQLLNIVQANTWLPASFKDNAIRTANNSILVAQKYIQEDKLGGISHFDPIPTQKPTPTSIFAANEIATGIRATTSRETDKKLVSIWEIDANWAYSIKIYENNAMDGYNIKFNIFPGKKYISKISLNLPTGWIEKEGVYGAEFQDIPGGEYNWKITLENPDISINEHGFLEGIVRVGE